MDTYGVCSIAAYLQHVGTVFTAHGVFARNGTQAAVAIRCRNTP